MDILTFLCKFDLHFDGLKMNGADVQCECFLCSCRVDLAILGFATKCYFITGGWCVNDFQGVFINLLFFLIGTDVPISEFRIFLCDNAFAC